MVGEEIDGPELFYNYALCGSKDSYTGTDSDPFAGGMGGDEKDDEEDDEEQEQEQEEEEDDEDDEDDEDEPTNCVPCRRRMLFATPPKPGLPCC